MTAREAYDMQGDPDVCLVDIRTPEQHFGQVSGYKDFTGKGRPKGSIYGGGMKNYASDGFKGDFSKGIEIW